MQNYKTLSCIYLKSSYILFQAKMLLFGVKTSMFSQHTVYKVILGRGEFKKYQQYIS